MPLPANLAANPNEFLDYYELLDQPETATIAELRGRINDLFAESQANRDHRNPQKRREYLMWLDILPGARSVLTDETKRAKYDDYRRRILKGETAPSYDEFLRELEGRPVTSPEEASVLGLREDPTKKTAEPVRNPVAPPSGGGGGASMGSIAALIALVVIAGIGFAVNQAAIGLIAGAVIAAVVFFAMRGGNKVAR